MKERSKELLKNTAIIAFGQLCTKFFSFILLPVYTRILKPEEFGTFDLYSTYCALLGTIVFLQIEQGTFRLLLDVRKDIHAQRSMISSAGIICAINSGFLAAGMIIAGQLWKDSGGYYGFIPLITLTTCWSGMCLQICRGLGDNVTYALGGIISASIQLVFNLIFVVYLKAGVKGLFYASIFGNIGCVFFVFVRKRLWFYIRIKSFSYILAKRILYYSIPLVPNAISWWILYASDRTITTIALGISATGLLAVASRFTTVFSSVYNIFHLSWVESASLHFHDTDREFYFDAVINIVFRGFFCFFVLLLSGFAACFPFLIGKNYNGSYALFPMYLGAALLNVIQGLYSVFYVAEKRTVELAKSTTVSAIINIFSYLLLLEPCGIFGAGLSTLISYAVVTIWRYLDIQKRLRVQISRQLMITSSGICFLFLLIYYIGGQVENTISFIVAIITSIYLNLKILQSILSKLQNISKGAFEI